MPTGLVAIVEKAVNVPQVPPVSGAEARCSSLDATPDPASVTVPRVRLTEVLGVPLLG